MKTTPPTAEQLDHLIGHTSNRALTPDEHAALRSGVRQLRASLAGTGAALRRASSGAYHRQVVQRAEQAEARIAAVRALADELEAEEAYGGYADANWEAAQRIRALLDAAEARP
ncbi:hypothetical protein ACFVFS_05705 [Kitasatospora sp. NPDC057692]|uniref:hypothetical protein n=1 Tax=Kitasatospora sp. NPDC057692 TaxID=3346215 RepID=UPI0036D16341